jgi:hypothetical protein
MAPLWARASAAPTLAGDLSGDRQEEAEETGASQTFLPSYSCCERLGGQSHRAMAQITVHVHHDKLAVFSVLCPVTNAGGLNLCIKYKSTNELSDNAGNCLYVWIFIYLSFIYHLSVHPSIHPPTHPSIYLFIYLSIYLSVCLSILGLKSF